MEATTQTRLHEGLDQKTRGALKHFVRDLRGLRNEAQKTHRFAALVGELFPDAATRQLSEGIEKVVQVQTDSGPARRRIDAYHGNAIFEFENSLKVSEDTALGQLREQAAGVWGGEKGPRRPLICIAADGVSWKVFRPRLRDGAPAKPRPADVELEPLRTLTLSEDSLREFWLWINSVLYGRGGRGPTADRFKNDFGATSPAFADAMAALREAWSTARALPEPQLELQGYGFWHWMDDVWLVSGVADGVTAKSLAEWLEKGTPGLPPANYIVLRVGMVSDFWGRNNKTAWEWFGQNWR